MSWRMHWLEKAGPEVDNVLRSSKLCGSSVVASKMRLMYIIGAEESHDLGNDARLTAICYILQLDKGSKGLISASDHR